MIFNSLEFAIFLPCVFVLYWLMKNARGQNWVLLLSSYYFYAWWDWRFLGLILLSSGVDYFIARAMLQSSQRKALLILSLCVNLGVLGLFKYANFFLDNFYAAFRLLGQPVAHPYTLQIILPVGISFYTFQTLSYTIDVYREKIKVEQDPLQFFVFVAYFPQLVAGPIERARDLLPQFTQRRSFEFQAASDGLRQMLWGLSKKILIADHCAMYVDQIFGQSAHYSGSDLFLGGVLFAFQIYGDFSGYSDIAIGASRLFGVSLQTNFRTPYFSRDIAEFWRRWHISLSSWFRDYVYIPLGGSRGTQSQNLRNVMIVFILSGFWHGAKWTFIVWGILNALFFVPLMLSRRHRQHLDAVAQGRLFPSVHEIGQMGLTFFACVLAWIFFRAEDLSQALYILRWILSPSILDPPVIWPTWLMLAILCLLLLEWFQREKAHALDIAHWPLAIRWFCYQFLIVMILWYQAPAQEFVYFQF